MDALDPTKKQKLAAQKRAQQLLSSLGISAEIKLSEYEMLIASQLVDPATINIGFQAAVQYDIYTLHICMYIVYTSPTGLNPAPTPPGSF